MLELAFYYSKTFHVDIHYKISHVFYFLCTRFPTNLCCHWLALKKVKAFCLLPLHNEI